MRYYVYILTSEKDGGYYVGSSKAPKKRLLAHNGGSVKSTKGRRPWVIFHTEGYVTRVEALARERKIKSFKGGVAFRRILGLE